MNRIHFYCFDQNSSFLDFGSSLKWTVLDQSERFMGVELDGQNDWNWKVSKTPKVDGPKVDLNGGNWKGVAVRVPSN